MTTTDNLTRTEVDASVLAHGARGIGTGGFATYPWWVGALVLLGIWVIFLITTDDTLSNIFTRLLPGVGMTIRVSIGAYAISLVLGLIIGLARLNPPQSDVRLPFGLVKVVVYNAATFYVEIFRGLPILVVILYVAFAVIPRVSDAIGITLRGSTPTSAMIALSLTYGAFLSEVFRAGIKSIDAGQMEAARSVGMNYFQAMRYIILPQAFRIILPPLGNDFIAIIKDSSLLTILGVRDITQWAKLISGQNFLYLQTYSLAAVLYLSMTIPGSMLVKYMERRLRTDK